MTDPFWTLINKMRLKKGMHRLLYISYEDSKFWRIHNDKYSNKFRHQMALQVERLNNNVSNIAVLCSKHMDYKYHQEMALQAIFSKKRGKNVHLSVARSCVSVLCEIRRSCSRSQQTFFVVILRRIISFQWTIFTNANSYYKFAAPPGVEICYYFKTMFAAFILRTAF